MRKLLATLCAALLLSGSALAQGVNSPSVNNGSRWVHEGGYEVTFNVKADHLHNCGDLSARDSTGKSGKVGITPGPGDSAKKSGIVHTPGGNSYRVRAGKAQVKTPTGWQNMKPGSDDVTTSPLEKEKGGKESSPPTPG